MRLVAWNASDVSASFYHPSPFRGTKELRLSSGWAGQAVCSSAQPVQLLRWAGLHSHSSALLFVLISFFFFLILALSTKYFSVFGMNAGRNGARSKQALCFQYRCFNSSVTVVLADCSSPRLPANIFWFFPLSFLTPAPCYQLLALGLCWAVPETCSRAAELCLPSEPSAPDAELLSSVFKIGCWIP